MKQVGVEDVVVELVVKYTFCYFVRDLKKTA